MSVWGQGEPFVSYAQSFEDVVLWRALKQVTGGTYVDVGAADPVLDSVTKAFYERGWSGVNVEPVLDLHARLVEDRPRDVNVRMGAGASAGEAVLHHFAGTGLSTFVGDVAATVASDYPHDESVVQIQTLDHIIAASLDPAGEIHFLKVDVEGFELDVLSGIDLAATRPWIIVVEATAPSSTVTTHHRWEHLLTDAGYEFVLFDGLNRFYLADEHPEIAAQLSYPACVFDQPFVSAREMAVARDLSVMVRQVEQVTAELETKQASLLEASSELRRKQRMLEDLVDLQSDDRRALADAAKELAFKHALLEQLVVQASEHAQTIESLNSELAALRSSRSWRLTRPLRALGDRRR